MIIIIIITNIVIIIIIITIIIFIISIIIIIIINLLLLLLLLAFLLFYSAEHWLSEMMKAGTEANTINYTTLIKACFVQGVASAEACMLLFSSLSTGLPHCWHRVLRQRPGQRQAPDVDNADGLQSSQQRLRRQTPCWCQQPWAEVHHSFRRLCIRWA